MTQHFRVTGGLRLALLVLAIAVHPELPAASIAGGYSADFSTSPSVADWSTFSIAGGAGDATSGTVMDAAVQNVAAASMNGALTVDGGNPAAALALGSWSSGGQYVQTRPTGNNISLILCTLVNNLGVNAIAVSISYDFAKVAVVAEEIEGHRAYYSLTGAPGSWTVMPEFSSANPGRLTASLSINWPNGSPLYIVWADDNGSGSPDTANQIDNFTASATPGTQSPVTITNQPVSQTVTELAPVTFAAGLTGYLPPTMQWYSNNVAIPAATNATFSIPSTPLHYHGIEFRLIAQNVASNVTYFATSAVAVLTVNADSVPPSIVNAFSAGPAAVAVSFTERVLPSTATNPANYVITNAAGAVLQITNALLSPDQTNVTLQTVAQAIGSTYTLVVNGVRDLAAAANLIAANSTAIFQSADFSPADIGSPALPGSIVSAGGGYNVTGSGTGIGGTSDQFTLAYQQKAGDFDIKVRVADLDTTHPWAHAAIMARDSLASNSIFAAAVAAPLITGTFFESRATTGAAATRAGNFPVSYPETWLRLRRVGNLFTGYAGIDGQTWVQLGSTTLAVGNVYVGFAVASHNSSQNATAQFRDYAAISGNPTVVPSMDFTTEPLSAAARTTPIVISEVMYRPGGTNTNSLEFIELYNSNPYFEDISGYRLSGDIDFKFPSNTFMPAGTFLVVAKDPAALQAAYGITGVMGPYSNSLPSQGLVRLRSDIQAIMLQVEYSDDLPWPVGADGTGHSLALTRPSYGQNDPQSWDASDRVGGSPGRHEPLRTKSGLRAVVINEVLAHTDLPQLDYVELYNYSTQAVDISGCYLSDTASTNKFRIPAETILPARGFISFNELTLGFALDHQGETIYFRSSDGTRMLDALQFEPQENGVAFGRFPDGAPEMYRLHSTTPGATNAAFRVDPIVINEIMYGPISEEEDDEFIELHNQGSVAIDISGWRFTSGIDFTFPPNTVIAPNSYIVAAKNAAHLLSHYDNLNATNTFGDYDGQLSRDGERLALAKPELDVVTNGIGGLQTNVVYIVVDEVTYKGGGRWGKWANQGGSSLELINPRANHRLAYNWGDSDETGKAPWTPFEHIGRIDTLVGGGGGGGGTQYPDGSAIDRLEITMLGEGECLLDELEVRPPGMGNLLANPGFEPGLSPWVPQGNHILSSLENAGYAGSRSLHIRAGGNGDTGANRIRSALSLPLVQNQTNVTLRGYVRWLRGWPEITMRIEGGYLEAYGRMTLPSNLGTPGARNSRALTNSAPAIARVLHSPALPREQEPVVVSAAVHDPDGLSGVRVHYRVDGPTPPAFTALAMNDNGTGGDAIANDGIFSATLPAQAANVMVGFYVEATDTLSATNQFPVNPLAQRECLVRWGDPVPNLAFASYRLWMSQANVNTYINRPALSNQDVDGTMVVANGRIIYNMVSHYSNSPYHQTQNGSPLSGGQHFDIHMPLDDKYLGTENFNKVHAPGNGSFDDPSLMREQTAFYLTRKLGLPYLHRRYVAMYVNGVRKGGVNALMEDTQRPGGEFIEQFFPDETEGRLFKLQPYFEFDDVTVTTGSQAAGFANRWWCTLTRNLSTNAHKIARYRQNFLSRSADKTANDYTNVIALIEAANVPPANPAYWKGMDSLIDVEEWARIFAVEHAVGNWDSFGNDNSQNMYGYKPKDGKWKLMIWDYNIVLNNPNLGGAGSDAPGSQLFDYNQRDPDNVMGVLNAYPPFRRAWWRGYKDLVNGPMLASTIEPVINAKYAAFLASGVNVASAPVEGIKTFIAAARTSIAGQVAAVDVAGFNISNFTVTVTSSNLATVTGTATFDVTDIEFNGISWPINWTSITGWSVSIPVTHSTPLSVVAYNRGRQVIGTTNTVVVNYAAPAAPDPEGFIVFNEIMYKPSPLSPDAEYIELSNLHSNFTFNVSGWRVNGIDYTFPEGSFFPPRSFVVLARDRVAFTVAYGASLPVFGTYAGSLQSDGETLALIRPASSTNEADVTVDRIRYEGGSPWPSLAQGTGSALQLVDPHQENARALNWFSTYTPPVFSTETRIPAVTNDGWRFVSITGAAGPGIGGQQMRFIMYLDEANGASALVDDISLVAGTNAAVGYNYIRNGDFETLPLLEVPQVTNSWNIGTNYTNTAIVGGLTHSGNGALRIEASTFGNSFPRLIAQQLSPAPVTNAIHTLSFWYFATNSATNLNIRLFNSASLNVKTNINIFITPSNYIPPQLVSPATNSLSPGAANQLVTNLPAFAPLWINEVQAQNLTGIPDNNGEREPWIEIFNTSSNSVSLEGLYLSSSYTNLLQWAFPAGATIGPRQFLVVFCDGEPNETTASEYHTSFRLAANGGSIALARVHTNLAAALNGPAVLDYVNYAGIDGDRSYGSYPDGQPFDRFEFFYVTPRATNDGRSAPLVVFINEWMASNTNALADPADGDNDDWFELYNPGPNAVDLAGYYLTDVLSNPTKYQITTNGAHVIPPQGYLLVWADNETGQNMSGGLPRTDLHVNFQLARAGEGLGLFAPDGSQVDAITFTNQLDDVSEGRFPNGSANIVPMPGSTSPRASNYLQGGNLNDPEFTRSVRNGDNLELSWSTVAGRRYAVDYKDNLNDPAWTPLQTNTASSTGLSFTNTMQNPPQRFFRIREVP